MNSSEYFPIDTLRLSKITYNILRCVTNKQVNTIKFIKYYNQDKLYMFGLV